MYGFATVSVYTMAYDWSPREMNFSTEMTNYVKYWHCRITVTFSVRSPSVTQLTVPHSLLSFHEKVIVELL